MALDQGDQQLKQSIQGDRGNREFLSVELRKLLIHLHLVGLSDGLHRVGTIRGVKQ